MYILILILPLLNFLIFLTMSFFLVRRDLYLILGCSLIVAWSFSILALFEVHISLCSCVLIFGSFFDLVYFFCPFILLFDELCTFMCFVILSVSILVHYYSMEYMKEDPFIMRFLSYLSLFTFFTLFLVTAGTVIQLFIGWEGVGLSSYLSINFWFTRIQAAKSALKAIVMNRFGDIGLYGVLIILLNWYSSLDLLSLSMLFQYEFDFILENTQFFLFNSINLVGLDVLCTSDQYLGVSEFVKYLYSEINFLIFFNLDVWIDDYNISLNELKSLLFWDLWLKDCMFDEGISNKLTFIDIWIINFKVELNSFKENENFFWNSFMDKLTMNVEIFLFYFDNQINDYFLDQWAFNFDSYNNNIVIFDIDSSYGFNIDLDYSNILNSAYLLYIENNSSGKIFLSCMDDWIKNFQSDLNSNLITLLFLENMLELCLNDMSNDFNSWVKNLYLKCNEFDFLADADWIIYSNPYWSHVYKIIDAHTHPTWCVKFENINLINMFDISVQLYIDFLDRWIAESLLTCKEIFYSLYIDDLCTEDVYKWNGDALSKNLIKNFLFFDEWNNNKLLTWDEFWYNKTSVNFYQEVPYLLFLFDQLLILQIELFSVVLVGCSTEFLLTVGEHLTILNFIEIFDYYYYLDSEFIFFRDAWIKDFNTQRSTISNLMDFNQVYICRIFDSWIRDLSCNWTELDLTMFDGFNNYLIFLDKWVKYLELGAVDFKKFNLIENIKYILSVPFFESLKLDTLDKWFENFIFDGLLINHVIYDKTTLFFKELLGFCIILAAVGKSAQIGLHTWLPDAMEGPTPVSALIHAATMVTAGIFVLIRFYWVLEQLSYLLIMVSFLGSLTVFFAGSIGSFQYDLKKVIAYSTCSQLGYMFFVCGSSNFSLSLFHLMNHAFFKALLFLGAGVIIHAICDDQDIRKMGNLWKRIPFVYIAMFIASLALIGIPFLSGFYSKDLLLESVFVNSHISIFLGYILCLLGIVFTTIYSLRVLILVFFTNTNLNKGNSTLFESTFFINIVLSLLIFLSIFGGFLMKEWLLLNYSIYNIWLSEDALSSEFLFLIIKMLPFSLICFSIIILNLFWSKIFISPMFYHFFNQKWYFDLLYNNFIVWSCILFSYKMSFKVIDRAIFEQWGSFGVSNLVNLSLIFKKLSLGHIYQYMFIFWNFFLILFVILKLSYCFLDIIFLGIYLVLTFVFKNIDILYLGPKHIYILDIKDYYNSNTVLQLQNDNTNFNREYFNVKTKQNVYISF